MSILIDRRLGAAPFWMPVERGWVEIDDDEIRIVESPSVSDIRSHDGPMLVDALLASTRIDTSRIVTNHAVTADTISLLTMVTSERPDEIERAAVAAPGVSLSGRAVAEIVIPEFYGIEISGWPDEQAGDGARTILITEDEQALLPTENAADYHEDLGRAWFLLTDTPFVSHVLLVPEQRVLNDSGPVRESVQTLDRIRQAADEQRRLLRRNISRDHDIDRELVVDTFDGLKFELAERARAGLTLLYERSGVLNRTGPIDERFLTF